jgi:hypothetical protein
MARFSFEEPASSAESLTRAHEFRSAFHRSQLDREDLSTRLNLALGQLADERLARRPSAIESEQFSRLRGIETDRESDSLRTRIATLESRLTKLESEITFAGLKSKALLSLASSHFGVPFSTVDSLIAFFERRSIQTDDIREIRRLNEEIALRTVVPSQDQQTFEVMERQIEALEAEIRTERRKTKRLVELNEKLARETEDYGHRIERRESKMRERMEEQAREIENLRAQVDREQAEIAWFDVIPDGATPGVQRALKEALEDRELSLNDRIRLALKRVIQAHKSGNDEDGIVKMAESVIPELCRVVLGQSYDARTLASSHTLQEELLAKVSDLQAARGANDRLAAELRTRTRKLSHLRSNLKEMNRQIERETTRRADSGSSRPSETHQPAGRPISDTAFGEYDQLVNELKARAGA